MNIKGSVLFSIAIFIFFVGAKFFPSEGEYDKDSVIVTTIIQGLQQLHYAPVAIDDKFSENLFDLYLDRIDSGKRWLTKKEVKQLEKYKFELDDQINDSSIEFFDFAIGFVDNGIERAKGYYSEILCNPFSFDKKETINLNFEDAHFSKNEKELKDHWYKILKYDVLGNLSDKLKDQKDKPKDEQKSFADLEIEARDAVLKKYDSWFERMEKNRREDKLSYYFSSITNVFDPHTSYFKPRDKESFDIRMSGTLEGIGARLLDEGEYTKVTAIVPGGPAWKQKDLEPEDLILKVKQEEGEAQDIAGWRIDDVVSKIRGKKGTLVTLTVKKPDGSKEDITIERDVVIMDESYAKSTIINLENSIDNIGYIRLPKFYADFNRVGGRSCAIDIEKEIEKLKAENVNGIILDLRNNGGGSLRDVVKMSGLFIEKGPIVQVKNRASKPEILSDYNSEVQYDGPLIIMVNQFSASASEILAAALQDYKRAVIVGTPTFGKGTVQRFIDLDRSISGNQDIKPLGNIKITIQKFFRINGGSTQLKGVTPDIILPDSYSLIETGEGSNEFPMPWTEIKALDYSQNTYKIKSLEDIISKSERRVKENQTFNLIEENAKRYKEQRDQKEYPLAFDDYKKFTDKLELEAEKYDDIMKEIPGLDVKNLTVDLDNINIDESKQARNEDFLKNLKEDVYLEECLYILKDMISQNN